jgi:hypothetical protein
MEIDLGATYDDPGSEPGPRWRCHHCGATGQDAASMAAATHVTEDRTYLRPYCDACLPSPPGRHTPVAPQWQEFYRTGASREQALEKAVEDGAVQASAVQVTQCPVCGTRVVDGMVGARPVYAVAADQDEAACVPCVETVSEAVIADAYQRRATGAPAAWRVGP